MGLILLLLQSCISRTLLHVVQVCRHGARAPIILMPWDIDGDRWPQGTGQLTPAGMRQHFLIGNELRVRYIQNQAFLPDNYDQQVIRVYSTDVNRTLQSALSQLQGLYPPKSGPDLRSANMKSKSVPPITVEDQDQIISELGMPALPSSVQITPVHSGEIQREFLLLAGSSCLRYMQELQARGSVNKDLQIVFENYSNTINSVREYMNQTYAIDWPFEYATQMVVYVDDSIKANLYNQYSVPTQLKAIKDEIHDYYDEINLVRSYQPDYAARLAGTDFLRKLQYLFNQTLNSPGYKQKFTFYSAHDTTLLNFLAALKLDDTYQPPFASTLFFELYEDGSEYYVDTYYNDVSQKLEGCQSSKCLYSQFVEFIEKRMLNVTVCESGIKDAFEINSTSSGSFDYADGDSGSLKWHFWFILVYFLVVLTGGTILIVWKTKKRMPHSISIESL